jgi:hypothetical protein
VANEEFRDRLASRLTFEREIVYPEHRELWPRTVLSEDSWFLGGFTKQAHDALNTSRLQVRVWRAADVVDVVLADYEQLPEEIKIEGHLIDPG